MKTYNLLILCFALSFLAGCSGTKKQLGLTRTAPDEFAVVKRAPLEMPPDYALRPPTPGAARPQEMSTDDQARTAVLGSDGQKAAVNASGTEAILLQQAGSNIVDPNIRETVDSETVAFHDRNKPVAEKIFGIGGDADAASATVVDAPKEAERIKENMEKGEPITIGETPSIEE